MPAAESLLRNRVGIEVDEITDAARFDTLGHEWTDLLTHSVSGNPFLTWEWLHAWTIHLGGASAVRLVTVRTADHQLVGIAPLCASRARLPWLSQIEFLGTGWAGSDYLDVVVRHGHDRTCIEALANWLRSRGQSVRFDHLPPTSVAAALGRRLVDSGWTSQSLRSGVCPYADLQDHTWETYIASLRPSQRTRCRRYLNTLHKKFEVSFERVETDSQRYDALSALMKFHEQRWTPRGGSTAFQTKALRAFHHDVTARALQSGWLRLFALRLNGDIAAVTYCFSTERRFYLYQHGFNPRFWPYSVGVVVLALTIRAAIEEGAAEFDMLYGNEPYKELWASQTRPLERLYLFPPHMRGRLHRRTVDAERTVRGLARRIFPRKLCDTNVPPAGAVS